VTTTPQEQTEVTNPQLPTEKWKATLDWFKQLMTVNGVAGVAIAAFLTFAGRTNAVQPETVTVAFAYGAIFFFLLSVGFAVLAMFRVINYVEPGEVDTFLPAKPALGISPFLYSAIGFVLFVVAVLLHLRTLYTFVA
jgi:hypothetical protein